MTGAYGVKPLPDPCSVPVNIARFQTLPCTPEEMMATFLTALKEAGGSDITIGAATNLDSPGIEFVWQETP